MVSGGSFSRSLQRLKQLHQSASEMGVPSATYLSRKACKHLTGVKGGRVQVSGKFSVNGVMTDVNGSHRLASREQHTADEAHFTLGACE